MTIGACTHNKVNGSSLLLTILLYLSMNSLFAQKLEIRGKVGTNTSFVSPDPNGSNASASLAFEFGGDIMYGKRFYALSGITYQRFRTKIEYTQPANFTQQYSANLICIPMIGGMRVLRPSSESKINGRIFGGVGFYYLDNLKMQNAPTSPGQIKSDDFNSAFITSNVGAGIDLFYFFADLSFEKGLTNIFKYTDYYGRSKYDALHLTIGARIRF